MDPKYIENAFSTISGNKDFYEHGLETKHMNVSLLSFFRLCVSSSSSQPSWFLSMIVRKVKGVYKIIEILFKKTFYLFSNSIQMFRDQEALTKCDLQVLRQIEHIGQTYNRLTNTYMKANSFDRKSFLFF